MEPAPVSRLVDRNRDQVATRSVTILEVMQSEAFATGYNEIGKRLPFNPEHENGEASRQDAWLYERGRLLGVALGQTAKCPALWLDGKEGPEINPRLYKLATQLFIAKAII